MSMGWMTVVAVMPPRPPLMKGRAARIQGLWRRSFFAALASVVACFVAATACWEVEGDVDMVKEGSGD